ncbi:MAG: hypothetical protein LC634_11720 [Sphingomonadales bacterium]|nr:hypothetical protein [Sphingomonadales bacterium]
MREIFSIGTIVLGAAYLAILAAANLVALESQMHWGIAVIALAAIILFKLWPALPVLAYLGAHNIWGWPWWVAGLFAFPICVYIAAHYWVRISDYWHRPKKRQQA